MNRILLSFMVAASPLVLAGAALAQSTGAAVVEVPAASAEEIEEAVAPVEESAASQEELPKPGLAEAARLSPEVIETWLKDPNSLLTSNPSAGQPMVQYVTLLAGSDARTVAPLIALAVRADVTARQVRAIAFGLGGAAKAAQETAPDYAAYILLLVASSGNERLIDYFGQALRGDGDIDTSELPGVGGAPGGGIGAGSGSVTGGGSIGTAGGVGGTSTVAGSSGSYSIGGGSAGGVTETVTDISPVIIR